MQRLGDIDGERFLVIDGDCPTVPGSVFLIGPRGFCMEFERGALIDALKLELGLTESFEVELGRLLKSA